MTQGPLTDEELSELERDAMHGARSLRNDSFVVEAAAIERLLAELRALRAEKARAVEADSDSWANRALSEKLRADEFAVAAGLRRNDGRCVACGLAAPGGLIHDHCKSWWWR